jgi:hypothetical protein
VWKGEVVGRWYEEACIKLRKQYVAHEICDGTRKGILREEKKERRGKASWPEIQVSACAWARWEKKGSWRTGGGVLVDVNFELSGSHFVR